MAKLGNVLKTSVYLTRIKNATTNVLHPGHPRHRGIKMQAHHAISAEGVKRSGLGNQLVQFGYDINVLGNLVFIPSTLQGACHLGVQVHRGDHTAIIEDDESDNDDDHPLAYHKMVEQRVTELKRLLTDKCPADDPDRRQTIQTKMNQLSQKIVGLIQNSPSVAALSRIATAFAPDAKSGCGGVDSVTAHASADCPVGRNHENQQGPGQKSEQITYKKAGAYQLQVGH